MNITVFLGSNFGNDPAYRKLTEELGAWIGDHGHTLVYGGAKWGLMGVLADTVLAHGGQVIGVMPDIIAARGQIYPHLSELIRTETMAERKTTMNRLGEAYIALPGGPGTLEEIAEVISQARLQVHSHPCIFLSDTGFYEPLKQYMDAMIREGFWKAEEARHVHFAGSVQEAAEIILDKVAE
ncbi:MAG: TIGR00730 family Rossman fold protein [Solobacterium sp.]|nr:TIGR00730 family Rossman fold protein [Solobacterium sp.]